jgi:hypothetical protein
LSQTELSQEEQKLSIGEFNYRKGLAVAIASHRTRRLVWAGIATLVGATIIIGYGNSLAR